MVGWKNTLIEHWNGLLKVPENPGDSNNETRNLVLYYFPYNLKVNTKIVMNYPITKTPYSMPFYFRKFIF